MQSMWPCVAFNTSGKRHWHTIQQTQMCKWLQMPVSMRVCVSASVTSWVKHVSLCFIVVAGMVRVADLADLLQQCGLPML